MLLTRAPLYSWYCYHFLVRLACVRHAASVDSEPGSNSRLKPDVLPSLTEVRVGSTASAHLFRRTGCAQILLPCENDQAKLDPFSRLACSTNLSKILSSYRLSGLVGSRPRLLRRGVLELVCAFRYVHFYTHIVIFARTFQTYRTCLFVSSLYLYSSESSSVANSDRPGRSSPMLKHRAAQNIK